MHNSFLFYIGNPETLYDSVTSKILSLPEDYLLYPAHDYNGLYDTWYLSFEAEFPGLT